MRRRGGSRCRENAANGEGAVERELRGDERVDVEAFGQHEPKRDFPRAGASPRVDAAAREGRNVFARPPPIRSSRRSTCSSWSTKCSSSIRRPPSGRRRSCSAGARSPLVTRSISSSWSFTASSESSPSMRHSTRFLASPGSAEVSSRGCRRRKRRCGRCVRGTRGSGCQLEHPVRDGPTQRPVQPSQSHGVRSCGLRVGRQSVGPFGDRVDLRWLVSQPMRRPSRERRHSRLKVSLAPTPVHVRGWNVPRRRRVHAPGCLGR